MPLFTLIFNLLSFFCLLTGFLYIRKKNVKLHKIFMILAFCCSLILVGLFLEHRLTDGFAINRESLNNHFGENKGAFLIFLFLHIFAAITSGLLSIPVIYWGLKGELIKHKKWAQKVYWIWVFSSLSGMLLYLMMMGL